MRYRRLGRTGLEVSEVGFGAWGIGKFMWIGADDDESLRALHRSFELGVNFVDTALGYGEGHSERLVGAAVRETGETVYVATKIPPKNYEWPARDGVDPAQTFPADWVVAKTEESLANLGADAIDVQQFHVWSDDWVGRGDWLEAVEQLKRDGKIRFFGISINDNQPSNALRLLETGAVDSVQVIYNVFEQTPEDELFAAVDGAAVGVIARVPFDEGSLAGQIRPETEFPDGDFRHTYFQGDRKREVWERVQQVADALGIGVDELPAAALRFCLVPDSVSTVIPGMRSVRHVEANVSASAAGPLTGEQVERLRPFRWSRHWYG